MVTTPLTFIENYNNFGIFYRYYLNDSLEILPGIANWLIQFIKVLDVTNIIKWKNQLNKRKKDLIGLINCCL